VANNWHFPLIDDDHNGDDNSLFPSDDEFTIIPTTNPPPVHLSLPAMLVPDSYWE
jgi:hypothetical protein